MQKKTLNQYLSERCKFNEIINPELKLLTEAIADTCKKISYKINQEEFDEIEITDNLPKKNIQGEVQKKLDIIANKIFLETNKKSGCLSAMASEEMENIYLISQNDQNGKYLLLFDPIDGSSNIAVNISIGSIFSVLVSPENMLITEQDFLQSGRKQVLAGYTIYGPKTQLVFTLGYGVVSFTLDCQTNSWILTNENICIPKDTKEFSTNMSNMNYWDKPIQRYIKDCLLGLQGPLHKDYNMRWVATMVADVHRILINGGIFLYTKDNRDPDKKGKLRLMYEANPMSFIIEQAGGIAISDNLRTLDIKPEELHQRVSLILGSKNEVLRINTDYLRSNIKNISF